MVSRAQTGGVTATVLELVYCHPELSSAATEIQLDNSVAFYQL